MYYILITVALCALNSIMGFCGLGNNFINGIAWVLVGITYVTAVHFENEANKDDYS